LIYRALVLIWDSECLNLTGCDYGEVAFWEVFFCKIIKAAKSWLCCNKNYGKWCSHLREFLLDQNTPSFQIIR